MKKRLVLPVLLVAIPLVAVLVGYLVQAKMGSQWTAAVTRELGAQLAQDPRFALEAVCATPNGAREFSEICTDYQLMNWMKHIALGAGAAGLGLLLLITLAGQVATHNRTLLLLVFRPLFSVTVFGVLGLIVVHGALLMASIWYGESALIGRVHVQIIALIGVGAVLGVYSMCRQMLVTMRAVASQVVGKQITPESNPALWRYVEDLARQLGTAPPRQIVAGLQPTFFVTESDLTCVDGTMKGRTLYLSLPFCRLLNRDELAAVVGHEMGHFRGADTQWSRRFYPIYRGAETALAALVRSTEGGLQQLSLIPAFYTLGYFLNAFAVAERAVSREREFLADQAGVQAAGVDAMGSALVKVHAYAEAWKAVRETMVQAIRNGQKLINTSELYAGMVQEHAAPDVLTGIADKRLAHPTDSHPPLSLRLEALGVSLEQVTEAALITAPEQPAIDLFADTETLERELTDIEHLLMVRSGRVAVGTSAG